jgi:hypothetical protein
LTPFSLRRLASRRWPLALGAAGLSLAALAASLWFFRIPIVEAGLRAALAERNVDADFRVHRVDFSGLTITGVTLGAEEEPDASVAAAEVGLTWRGLTPGLGAVRLTDPRLRLRVDQQGRVSAGQLSNFSSGGAAAGRPHIPEIELEISGGQALVEGPFGTLPVTFESSGVIGRDFAARAQLATTTRPGADYALEAAQAELVLAATAETGGALAYQLNASAQGLRWDEFSFSGGALSASGAAALDLSNANTRIEISAGALGYAQTQAEGLSATLEGEGALVGADAEMGAWSGAALTQAARVTVRSASGELARLDRAHFTSAWRGNGHAGDGEFALAAGRLAAFGLISDAPSAAGQFALDLDSDESLRAGARAQLQRSRLDADAQAALRRAVPDLSSMPPGPLLTAIEAGLDRAADAFTLDAPLQARMNSAGLRIIATQAIEARARSGAVLRAAPLRPDAPGLVMQWPGARLHGAVAIEASGGGMPHIALLIDAMDWAPGAPLDGDGTLSIHDWRSGAGAASIEDMRVALTAPPNGEARLDLDGAARLSGPLGAGAVRGLNAELDVVVNWRNGWRVAPDNGCIPIRIAEADAPGLSFYGGAMRVCSAAGGSLLAVDAQGNLSGGFAIDNLSLSGRMNGAEAQPAHLRARSVSGRFQGTMQQFGLAMIARDPRLNVEMGPERLIELSGESLTADLVTGDGAWEVDGRFESGVLNDPALPGEVSAIGGQWRAAPEGEDAVVRVSAGQGYVVARDGLVEGDSRPLFNPLQISDASAVMRGENIAAQGDILLAEGARGIARFTAEHNLGDGVGVARIEAEAMVFNDDLQPFELSELARGVFENVNGRASVSAVVNWRNDAPVTADGVVRLHGVSMATATLPVITNVNGDIVFDDLFALTTPPGQVLSVGQVNPGVAVRDGEVQFQLLPEQRVAIERAEFDFASGVLAVTPTVLTLGSETTELELTLRDVDVAALIGQLNFPDLTATGRVEGSFPMILGKESSEIRGGVLRAAPGGGTIAYTGHAGDGATGPAAMAFQALTNFRYDELVLNLDGDLNDELVTQIRFSGENTGRTVELGASVGGMEAMRVSGVPFRFNVNITAPFRGLSETVSSITDPGAILEQDRHRSDEGEGEIGAEIGGETAPLAAPATPEAVDPAPVSPE